MASFLVSASLLFYFTIAFTSLFGSTTSDVVTTTKKPNSNCPPPEEAAIPDDIRNKYMNTIKANCDGVHSTDKSKSDRFGVCKKDQTSTFKYDTKKILGECKNCFNAKENGLEFLCAALNQKDNQGQNKFDCVLKKIRNSVGVDNFDAVIENSSSSISKCCSQVFGNPTCAPTKK